MFLCNYQVFQVRGELLVSPRCVQAAFYLSPLISPALHRFRPTPGAPLHSRTARSDPKSAATNLQALLPSYVRRCAALQPLELCSACQAACILLARCCLPFSLQSPRCPVTATPRRGQVIGNRSPCLHQPFYPRVRAVGTMLGHVSTPPTPARGSSVVEKAGAK